VILADVTEWLSECGIALVSLVILVFIVNRLGLIAWFSWISRRTQPTKTPLRRNTGARTNSRAQISVHSSDKSC
jgi:hypothetical protein